MVRGVNLHEWPENRPVADRNVRGVEDAALGIHAHAIPELDVAVLAVERVSISASLGALSSSIFWRAVREPLCGESRNRDENREIIDFPATITEISGTVMQDGTKLGGH
jgi:hypothetical protein